MALSVPDKQGVTRREHLLAMEEQTGKAVLDEPEPPEAGRALWDWFLEMDEGRQSAGFGPLPLAWQDMRAWATLTGTPLRPWHVTVLRAMDNAYLRAWNKHSRK